MWALHWHSDEVVWEISRLPNACQPGGKVKQGALASSLCRGRRPQVRDGWRGIVVTVTFWIQTQPLVTSVIPGSYKSRHSVDTS